MSRSCCKQLPLISKGFHCVSAGPRDMKRDIESPATLPQPGNLGLLHLIFQGRPSGTIADKGRFHLSRDITFLVKRR